MNRGSLADGLIFMKMAESMAKKVGDTQLLIMAYTNMAIHQRHAWSAADRA